MQTYMTDIKGTPLLRLVTGLKFKLSSFVLLLGCLIMGPGSAQAGQIGVCPANGPLTGSENYFNYSLNCTLEVQNQFTNYAPVMGDGGRIEGGDSNAKINIGAGAVFTNRGAMVGGIGVVNNGTLDLEANSVLDLKGERLQSSRIFTDLFAGGQLTNHGTLNVRNELVSSIDFFGPKPNFSILLQTNYTNRINNQGTVNIFGSMQVDAHSGAKVVLSNTHNVKDGGVLKVNKHTVENRTGTLTNEGLLTTTAGSTLLHTNTSTFVNQGLVENSGTLVFSGSGSTSNQGGTIQNSGTVTLQGEGRFQNDAGVIQNDNVVRIEDGGSFQNTGGATINGSAIDVRSGGKFQNFSGTTTNNSTIDVWSGGTLQNLGGTTVNNGTLDVRSGGAFENVGGTVQNAGTFSAQAGALVNLGNGQFFNTGTVILDSESAVERSTGSLIVNSGTIIANGGDQFSNYGGRVRNRSGGSMAVSGEFSVERHNGVVTDAGSTFETSGTLTIKDGSVINDGEFVNTGTVILDSRRESADFDNTGRFTNATGGVLTLREDTEFFNQGELINHGTVDTSDESKSIGGTVVNQGTIIGGSSINRLTLSGDVSGAGNYEGTINFNGDFRPGNSPALVTAETLMFGSSSSLFMEIGGYGRGSEYDAIDALSVTLDGLLDVALIDLNTGFTPMLGDTFDIIIADQIFGNFASFEFATLATGLAWGTNLFTNQFGDMVYQLVVEASGGSIGVPTPGTLILLAFGLLGVAVRRRRTV